MYLKYIVHHFRQTFQASSSVQRRSDLLASHQQDALSCSDLSKAPVENTIGRLQPD